MPIRKFIERFRREDQGSIILIIAFLLTVLLGIMALGVDLGALYFSQKSLQSKTDLAAISAATDLRNAPGARVSTTVEGNGLDDSAISSVTYGKYLRDAAVPVSGRLAASDLGVQGVNAATVKLSEEVPLYFSKVFLPQDNVRISATATAANFNMASFSLGSRALTFEGGLLNSLLSTALGSSVNFGLADYRSLANAQVNLLDFSDALGNRIDAQVGDYKNILVSEIDLTDVAGAIADTNAVSGSNRVLERVSREGNTNTFNFERVIATDGDNVVLQLSEILPTISVSALDLLIASVDVVNAGRPIQLNLTPNIANLGNIEMDIIIGQRAQSSGWVTLGEQGATVHTAQARVRLNVAISTSVLSNIVPDLDIVSINLPIYVELASATATLTELNCSAMEPADIVARFDTGADRLNGRAGSHGAEVFLGNFPDVTFRNLNEPLSTNNLQFADLLRVNVLRLLFLGLIQADVKIKAHAILAASQQGTTTFTLSEVPETGQGGSTKTFGSGDVLSSAVSSLAQNAQIEANVTLLGLNLSSVNNIVSGILTTLSQAILPVIAALVTPLDTVIDDLRGELGIGLAETDLTLDAVACDRVFLVR